ncbi:hypothetical protein CR513_03741, partial [Mucuna pruriens]
MTHAMPWYANICNFLIASTYPLGASKAAKEKLESDAKYNVWDDPYLWRLCNDQIPRSSRSSTFVTQRLKEANMDQCGQVGKSSFVGYTGPLFSKTLIPSSRLANSARESEWL